jgi:ubiquinone/menaquinone biosynthesis C-methylase UbiE
VTDWVAWHEPYRDPGSPLSRRLRIVQDHIATWLDERAPAPVTVVSVCAGQGDDLIGVLRERSDAGRVRAILLEYDERNVAAARAAAAGMPGVEARHADAGDLASYPGAVPADLVLLAGVLGNIDDADIRTTLAALPRLCAPGATVIWTRSRHDPDRTPAIRSWLRAAGFAERAFTAPPDVLFSVGVHRLVAAPRPLIPTGRLFRFT